MQEVIPPARKNECKGFIMPGYSFYYLFHLDALAGTMIFLVAFIGIVVTIFASRYMQGDRQYGRFLWLLALLIISVTTMVAADNLFILLFAWLFSNSLLITLMIHKHQWRAALNAGLLTAKTFAIGFASLACAFTILYLETGTTSIREILEHFNPGDSYYSMAMILMLIAAMTQSAIWPFHRWLISSLNSPTPVSAIMHAGLVNGGGFLLARFAPMYLSNAGILNVIFVLGMITAFLGTLWKLIQHDVKRMLACSTMGQMGFMLAQCGLGLFPAAIAHLCWHGMFKANLFLSSNSAAQENRFYFDHAISLDKFIAAIMCGLAGSYFFSIAIHSGWQAKDTTLILIGLCFITASQFSLSIIISSTWKKLPIIIILTSLLAYLYGCSVYLMETVFQTMHLFHPQPLNPVHLSSLLIFVVMWVATLFNGKLLNGKKTSRLLPILYMKSLNASQPHPSTITTHRNHYRYE
jgi:NAD(P)H-quinone oxidoreductase subunit 5